MTRNPGRRDTLMFLAGVALPSLGWPGLGQAQEQPAVPQVTPPVAPPAVPAPSTEAPAPSSPPPTSLPAPTPPPAQAVRRPPPPPAAIDRTKSYYVFFDQNIDVASMRSLRRQLTTLVEAGVSDITLVIDSAGGLLEATLITYSFIRALPARINTHAQGYVQSAATILFLAGQERSADRNVRFLFHPSRSPINGLMDEQQVRESLMGMSTVRDVVGEIYRDRTSLSDQEIDRFSRETAIYTAAQALAAGVIQTVADLRIPGDGKARILFQD